MNAVWLGSNISYTEALEQQKTLVEDLLTNEAEESILLLEHSPIYTIGRTRDHSSLNKETQLPFPTIEINRGGQGTYHGPGQLVAYPIFRLERIGKDLHAYLRLLESTLIDCCAEFQVKGTQLESMTGVWANGRKIASIGIGVKKWISMHGIAINIMPESLAAFQHITPCGIKDVEMTCLWNETSEKPTPREFGELFAQKLTSKIL